MVMLVIRFVLLLGIGLTVFGVWALLRWHGVWRWASLVPLLLVLVVVLRIVIDVRANPTSHNLWPFEVLAGVMAAGVLLGVIALIRLGLSGHGRGGPT